MPVKVNSDKERGEIQMRAFARQRSPISFCHERNKTHNVSWILNNHPPTPTPPDKLKHTHETHTQDCLRCICTWC